jgi:hypothetical protein
MNKEKRLKRAKAKKLAKRNREAFGEKYTRVQKKQEPQKYKPKKLQRKKYGGLFDWIKKLKK